MQLLCHDHANQWPCLTNSCCCHAQISTWRTQQSTNITFKAAASIFPRSSSRMDEDDDGSPLIIMACMAQYCNYWRRMKLPIAPVLVAAVEAEVRPFLLVPFIFISCQYLFHFASHPMFNYILLLVVDDTTSAKGNQCERKTQQSN